MKQEEDKVSTQVGKKNSATVFIELLKALVWLADTTSNHGNNKT